MVANINRTEPSADINAYIIGGLRAGENFQSWGRDETGAFGSQGIDSKGTPNFAGRKFFVNGTSKNSTEVDIESETERMMNTIAHEIGHVMLNAGHPNLNADDPTTHPLPRSYWPDRLMYMWPFAPATARRKLLVKGEWDEIEAWLVAEEAAGRL